MSFSEYFSPFCFLSIEFHSTFFISYEILLYFVYYYCILVRICHFPNISVHFVFCQLNFILLFSFLMKYYYILFIIIVFWLGCDRPSGLLLFVPALLLSILTPLLLPSSSVSLCYFVLAGPMRECLGKHSCLSSTCPIAILNGTFHFREAK